MTCTQTSMTNSAIFQNPEFTSKLFGDNLPEDYCQDLANFLEEADYQESGPPNWVMEYYLYDEPLETQYNTWQCTTPELTDGIVRDGDQHLTDYYQHVYHSESYHGSLVKQCESFPYQEPYWQGPPIHCSYSQVSVPYELLPGMLTLGHEANTTLRIGAERLVPMIIGRQGCYLKQLTEECGLHYLWFNKNPFGLEMSNPHRQGVFEVWGRQEQLPYAVARLKTHMQFIISKIWNDTTQLENEEAYQDEEEYSSDDYESYSSNEDSLS